MLTWKLQMSITLLITHAFVNFLALMPLSFVKLGLEVMSIFS